jgi:hypothetical protein
VDNDAGGLLMRERLARVSCDAFRAGTPSATYRSANVIGHAAANHDYCRTRWVSGNTCPLPDAVSSWSETVIFVHYKHLRAIE